MPVVPTTRPAKPLARLLDNLDLSRLTLFQLAQLALDACLGERFNTIKRSEIVERFSL